MAPLTAKFSTRADEDEYTHSDCSGQFGAFYTFGRHFVIRDAGETFDFFFTLILNRPQFFFLPPFRTSCLYFIR